MSARLEILSGLGGKAPAALLLEAGGARILIEAGGALEPGVEIGWDLPQGRRLDAVVISHDHVDHIGAADRLPANLPVYATEPVASALPEHLQYRPLPLNGELEIAGIRVRCGQAGHSLGGVWLHFDIGAGLFYSGDYSLESTLFRFDPPPPAELALLDASYGLYDKPQSDCRAALLARLEQPTLLPVPASGRALEMALWLEELGIDWAMDQRCTEQLEKLKALPEGCFQPGTRERLERLSTAKSVAQCQVALIGSPEGIGEEIEYLIAKGDRQLIYAGYTPPKARADVEQGRASWLRWNVHPRSSDLGRLTKMLGAQRAVPLFTGLDPLTRWRAVLGDALYLPACGSLDGALTSAISID